MDDTVGKIFGKLGITGMASAILTIVFGIIVLMKIIDLELIIGLYLLVVGVMNLTGYVISMVDKKDENIYIETETLKTK